MYTIKNEGGSIIATHKLAVSTALQGYQLIELVGEGGTGSVFKALQKSTGQIVALKLLRQENRLDDARRKRLIERFDRETQLCAQLHHPHIVRLLDKGQADANQLFAVFEFVHGETLKDLLLRQGALSAVAAAELMGQVLDALAYAHSQGIVHRDLKPHNIMVMTTGMRSHVKVLDFGIAAFIPELQKADYRNLTLTREALGTPSYSAPEQLRGEPPTIKTDLYAWGLVLIECLTGRPAIQGVTLAEIFHKQLSSMDVPLPPALVGHPLADLLRRALQKNPRDRAEQATSLYADFSKLNLGNIVGNLNPLPQQAQCDSMLDGIEVTRDDFHAWQDLPYERRQMTVLCCTLSLVVTTDIELEILEALQRDQLSLCIDTASRYGGHLAGSLGDNLMFYYGYPYASDNDVRRAARTALELVGQVHRRSRLLEVQQGIRLEISVGIHTGIVISRSGHAPTGLTPNIALHLNGFAAPGTVVVSAATRQLLQQYIEFEESRCLPVGGMPQALSVFLLTAEHDAEAFSFLRAGNANRPLVGRTREMQSLMQHWHAAKAAQGRTVLLIGEAGIGKSRLAYEAYLTVRQDGLIMRECRCLPEHRNNALYPLLQMLKTHLHLQEVSDPALATARLQSVLEGYECNMEWVLPILCSWLSLPIPDNFPPAQHSPDRQKKILLDVLEQFLTRLGNGNPFLLVVEDIHWLDQTSLELLDRVIGNASRYPFLLILTARPEFPQRWDAHSVIPVNLGRLSGSDAEQLIFKLIDGKPIDEKSLSIISERVDGIPLFIEEFTRMLLDNRLLVERNGTYQLDEQFDAGGIPITLRDSLTERLGHLGAAKETAQLAAAIGREFDYSLLVDVSLRDEATVQTDLDQLIAADLVYRQRRVHGDSYIFRHALIRDAAYDAMPKNFRQKTHARIARVMESQTAVEVARNLAPLARHFANANEFVHAIRYGIKAAQVLLERALHDDAITYASEVLRWIEKLASDERVEAELNINRILTHGLMSKYGWADARVKASAERSLHLLETLDDSAHKVPTLWALATYHHVASHRQAVRELTDQLIALSMRSKDKGLKTASNTMRGVGRWIDGNYAEAAQACEEVIRDYHPEQHADHGYVFGVDSRIWAMAGLGNVRWFLDADDTAAFAYARQAVAHAEQLNHIPSLGVALMYLAYVHQYADDRDGAQAICNRLLALAQKYGLPAVEGYAAIVHSWATSNIVVADAVLAELKQMGCMLGFTYAAALAADIEARTGNGAGAIKRIDDCLVWCDEIDEHYYKAELFRKKAMYRARHNAINDQHMIKEDLIMAISHAERCGMKKTVVLAKKALQEREEVNDEEMIA